MISLKQIEAFVAVADHGGFRRAAERLNTTQPNISARIASLEALLGLSLMDRDAGSVRLTAKGEALLPHARAVLAGVERFLQATDDPALLHGVIRLGVTEVVAQVWLAEFLRTLKARFPSVVVELTVDFSAVLTDALRARRIDLALQSGPFDQAMSGEAALAAYPMVWLAAPGSPLVGRRLTMAEIAAEPILTAASGTLIHKQLKTHLAGVKAARIAPSTNLAVCIQMAVDGLGVACAPRIMAAEALAAGRLVTLDYAWAPDPLTFAARYDADTAPLIVRDAAGLATEIAARNPT